MKILVAVLLIATVLLAQALPRYSHLNKYNTCCFSFSTMPFPLSVLRSYDYTSEGCPLPGVIFTTQLGRRFCTAPLEPWVLDRIRHLPRISACPPPTTSKGCGCKIAA